jgi:hypothetical protein
MGPAPGISAQRHTPSPAHQARPSTIYQTLTKGDMTRAVQIGLFCTRKRRGLGACF